MRLPKLDYYRQFADVDQEEENRVRRQRRAHERALELERVPDLDLSGTEWPELPDSEVVNASIYTARGRVNGYPDRHAEGLRTALAELHGVEPERIVVGNGAAELLQAAALSLMEPGRRAAGGPDPQPGQLRVAVGAGNVWPGPDQRAAPGGCDRGFGRAAGS